MNENLQPEFTEGMALSRREFVAATSVFAFSRFLAGPALADLTHSSRDEFPIPRDKNWNAAWLRSLTERGEPRVLRSSQNELSRVGFPVGGICCGQVYLAGDGRLWHWDIFNLPQDSVWSDCSGPLYAKPADVRSPMDTGLTIKLIDGSSAKQEFPLDANGFSEVTFQGQWPIARVNYRDPKCPLSVELEAYSPFCPLDVERSALPATLMCVTLRNDSKSAISAEISARLENAVCLKSEESASGVRINRTFTGDNFVGVQCLAEPAATPERRPQRPDVLFENFENGKFDAWTATGTAFGERPRKLTEIAGYQGNLKAEGEWVVNSHNSAHGENVQEADAHIGTLTSRTFKIERHFISFRIGGGNHSGQTCVNLLVDGAPVRTATGQNDNRMRMENWDVREFAGRDARIQLVDAIRGGWGHIGCDDIVLADEPRREFVDLRQAPDFGTMALAVLGPREKTRASTGGDNKAEYAAAFPGRPTANVGIRVELQPGESTSVTFVYAWHFATPPRDEMGFLRDIEKLRRHYANKFEDAAAVVRHIAAQQNEMTSLTRMWRDTWYDSTLPYWFLDRTMANTSTLATVTCHLFDSGRFYGWEGTHSCAGTCTHVWHYAQAVGRLFPQLERSLRKMVDFDLEFDQKSGVVHYRGEAARELAVDGQAGVVLRVYREHQMSASADMLQRIWPRVRGAIECLLKRDTNADGLLDGAQYNTLDATWWGQISWISSMYLAAVQAGVAMATEMGDTDFASTCRERVERGSKAMVERLFDGEYFIHLPDPAHPEANSTGTGCHIDQLLGQFWAHQVGLPRIVPREQTISALRALYRYNVAPDIGTYRKRFDATIKGGRWYAMPGEGGALMCTWPKGGAESATGKGGEAWAAGYFNECMSGFEHQLAAHMMSEGLVEESLATTRLIHDRYDASRRNPWNEVECSNHYARAMASYGTFLAACGFEYHGPKGHIGFSPRISPQKFKAAFVGAEGWGTFEQSNDGAIFKASLHLKWGQLRLRSLAFEWSRAPAGIESHLRCGGKSLTATVTQSGPRVTLALLEECKIEAGQTFEIELTVSAK